MPTTPVLNRVESSRVATLDMLKHIAAASEPLTLTQLRKDMDLTAGQLTYRVKQLEGLDFIIHGYGGEHNIRITNAGRIAAETGILNGYESVRKFASQQLARLGATSFTLEESTDEGTSDYRARNKYVLDSSDEKFSNELSIKEMLSLDHFYELVTALPDDIGDAGVYAAMLAYRLGSNNPSLHRREYDDYGQPIQEW